MEKAILQSTGQMQSILLLEKDGGEHISESSFQSSMSLEIIEKISLDLFRACTDLFEHVR